MGQLNIRSVDIKYTASENVSAKKDTKDVSDDFKKLLGESPERDVDSQMQEDVKPEADKEAAAKPENGKTQDNTKTEEMLQGMQFGQILWGIQSFQVQQKAEANVDTEQNLILVGEITDSAAAEEVPVMPGMPTEQPAAEEAPVNAAAGEMPGADTKEVPTQTVAEEVPVMPNTEAAQLTDSAAQENVPVTQEAEVKEPLNRVISETEHHSTDVSDRKAVDVTEKAVDAPKKPEEQKQDKVTDTDPQTEKPDNIQMKAKPEEDKGEAHVEKVSQEQSKAQDTTENSKVQEEYTVQPLEVHTVKNEAPVQKTQQVHTQTMHVSQPEEIPEKLPAEILKQLSRGVKEFEIQIAPEHLGKIAIKVHYEDEQTIISIACSERKTLDIMGRNARELGTIMERNLGGSTDVYVEEKAQDYMHQKQDENDHSGREAEQERQREESRKQKTDDSGQFLQKLRLGLIQ